MSDFTRLNAVTLGELNSGRAGIAINAALAQCLTDLDQRGDDEKVRKATIIVSFKKVEGTSNFLMDVQTKVTMPTLDSGSTMGNLVIDGSKVLGEWRPDSPQRPDQPSMFRKHPENEGEED